ncbi:MAG: L-histidine N(alpha)-methyltransferase [Myxococcales bacterium]|nr:L-histidine N(alpha)-methyltransferase [Myxococcales bacterium]
MSTINILEPGHLAGDEREQFALDVLMGLSTPRRSLPSKYFYDAEGSRLFQRITTLDEYYPTRCEAEVLRSHCDEITGLVADRPTTVVELGAGDGSKTRILLRAFAERGLSSAAVDMREVAPSYVGAVPRFYEKIQLGIEAEFARRSRPERLLIERAFEVARRVSRRRAAGQGVSPVLAAQARVADKTVFAPIRARFGGKLRFFVSGAAPLSRETAEFFHAIGLLILEGYGLTETTGATHVNRPDRFRFGTVGPALPGCEVLIGPEGEILLRGHNVMRGYHNQPEATAAIIDADGWLHTGDVGEIDGGFLRITDRLKDIIITAGGKNIAPQKLENRLRAREGIAHVLVTGDRRPHLVALIALDADEMMALSKREGLGCRDYADLARNPRIRERVGGFVGELNRELQGYETIKTFAIPPEPFAADLLTPTLKLKRRAVEARYAGLIDSLYVK